MVENLGSLHALLELAYAEDVGSGDVTTAAVVPPQTQAQATLLAKQPCVLFGVPVFVAALRYLDATVEVEVLVEDGQPVAAGTKVASIRGPAAAILTGERVALNLLQRLSGVATLTRATGVALRDFPNVRLLDTRKTTPGLRLLEKAAVRAGGGTNHRTGLFDGVLIKDNHVAVAGGVAAAVASARRSAHHLLKIQVEVVDADGVQEALDAGADAILLDNMDNAAMAAAVKTIRAAGRLVFIEASGGMTTARLGSVAALGVDGISMGALTHSATAVDFSLEFEPAQKAD